MNKRKPFLQLSKRQQRRRLAAVARVDNAASLSDSEVDVTNYDVRVNVESNVEDNLVVEESENENVGDEIFASSSEERMNEIEDNDINMDIDKENVEENLAAKLCDWALLFGISHMALSALLIILRIYLPVEQLPKDARTLLCTPRKTVIRKVTPGNYFHYGLLKGITDELRSHTDHSGILDKIYIDIGIDGLPIAKSSRSQLWPILGKISNTVIRWNPFVIGYSFINFILLSHFHTLTYIFDKKTHLENFILFFY